MWLSFKVPDVLSFDVYRETRSYKLDAWFVLVVKIALCVLGMVAFVYMATPRLTNNMLDKESKIKFWLNSILDVVDRQDVRGMQIVGQNLSEFGIADRLALACYRHVVLTCIGYIAFACYAIFQNWHRVVELAN